MSDYRIREATLDDHTAIASFTNDTFTWGDYVGDAFGGWLADPHGTVVVAVDADDVAIGMSRATMVSATEAWFQGARVREDWRRRGIAGAMASTMIDWARHRGARVSRLLVEDWNEPAQLQVVAGGFRAAGRWVAAERTIGAASPVPSGNGGRRVPALEQLVRAHSAEAEPAFMSWSTGELGRASRSLIAVGWSWRRVVAEDLVVAAKAEALWAARSGWAVAARNEDSLEVGWVETRREDARDLIRALVDLAVNEGAERIEIKLPAVDWLTSAVRRAGCELWHLILYERPIEALPGPG
jgi:GNAT superfamily N-acetyltransferase